MSIHGGMHAHRALQPVIVLRGTTDQRVLACSRELVDTVRQRMTTQVPAALCAKQECGRPRPLLRGGGLPFVEREALVHLLHCGRMCQ